MLITLEQLGRIRRQPRVPRSIELLIDPATLPALLPSRHQPVKTSVHGLEGELHADICRELVSVLGIY